MWRHNYVIGRNEYLISTLSESINPCVYSLQFLFKSTNNSWRYERKCEWVFFSEHSVLVLAIPAGIANTVFSIARVLQYFKKINIGIGINNTIMNIGSSFLLIPIVNTFMKQNCRIYTILVLLGLHRSLRRSTKTSWIRWCLLFRCTISAYFRHIYYLWRSRQCQSVVAGCP